MSSAVSDFSSLGKTLSSGKSLTESFGSREAVSAGKAFSNMINTAENIAKNQHADVNDVFRGLVNFSQQGELGLGISASGKLPTFKVKGVDVGIGGDVGLKGKLSTEHTKIQESSTQHGVGRSISITAEQAKRFSDDLNKIEEYSKTSHADTTQSTAVSQLSQLSTDLRNARSASEQYTAHKAESERLNNAASYVRQHSSQIDSDHGQELADYVVNTVGQEEAEQLFAGKNIQKLESIANGYISNSGVENAIIARYQQNSAGINPDKKYDIGAAEVNAKASNINLEHENYKRKIVTDAKPEKLGVDERKYESLVNKVDAKNEEIAKNIADDKSAQSSKYKDAKNEVTNDIKEGKEKSKNSVLNIKGSVKPKFTSE